MQFDNFSAYHNFPTQDDIILEGYTLCMKLQFFPSMFVIPPPRGGGGGGFSPSNRYAYATQSK